MNYSKRNILIIFLVLFPVIIGCKKNIAIVNAQNGLVLREMPSTDSKRLYSLINNTSVIILEKGPSESLEGNINNWYKIKIGEDIGWVFGAHLNRISSENNLTKILYSAAGNSTAIIYVNLYKNNIFNLYFESMLGGSSKYYIITGKWSIKDEYITLVFDKNQINAPNFEAKKLFVKPDGNKWDEDLNIIDDYTYSFNKKNKGISLWGVSCMKFEYN